jgi:hypothetical protein
MRVAPRSSFRTNVGARHDHSFCNLGRRGNEPSEQERRCHCTAELRNDEAWNVRRTNPGERIR